MAGSSTNKEKKTVTIGEEVSKQGEIKQPNPKQSVSKPVEISKIKPNKKSTGDLSGKPTPTSKKILQQIPYDAKNGNDASRKKVNQSAVVHQLSPPLFANKKSIPRKVSPGAAARNSPRILLPRKRSPSGNMLSEQIENICQVLECLNQQEKSKAPGSNSNEDINRMLRNILKTELKKLGKNDSRGTGLPISKERKNSIANMVVPPTGNIELKIGDDNPQSKEPTIETKVEVHSGSESKLRHRTPGAERRDQGKPAINVSINHNVGSLCYAPVFIGGHNRSSSKENPLAHGNFEVSHIKTGTNIVNPKKRMHKEL